MKTSHIYFGFVTTAILCINVPASGQTKEETKKFLVEKCESKWSDNAGNYVESVSFDGDTFVITHKCYDKSTGKIKSLIIDTGKLADLNPNQVSTDYNDATNYSDVWVNVTGKKQKITRKHVSGSTSTFTLSGASAWGLDQRTAAQVNKAFRHLITLCDGKGELFEEDTKESDAPILDVQRSSKKTSGSNPGATSTASPSPKAGTRDSKSRATEEIKVTIPKTIIPKDAKVSWTQYGLSDAINTSAYSNATKGADGSYSIKCKPNLPLWIKVNDGKAKRIDLSDKDKTLDRIP